MTSAVQSEELFEVVNLPWFWAGELGFRGDRYISVYRSVWVKDADTMYEPVAQALRGAELIAKETVQDEDMIFGRAEWLLYKLR